MHCPYDCAIWLVQAKRDKIAWNLGSETWKEPEGLEANRPGLTASLWDTVDTVGSTGIFGLQQLARRADRE
jgi:hypothetical protein